MVDPIQAYEGIHPIVKGVFFAYPATPVGTWPVTPMQVRGLGSPSPRPRMAQGATTPVFQWPGKTAVVLGPSSWGFGIGWWPGTAYAVPPLQQARIQAGWF